MKNAFGQSGIKSSVRRSISIILVFAALAGGSLAKAADVKNLPSDGGPNVQLVNGSDQNGAPFKVLDGHLKTNRTHGDLLLAQLPALFCYTDFGRYPMAVALPPGVPCHVNVLFPPYVLAGITGY
jgi:hypothetical protein